MWRGCKISCLAPGEVESPLCVSGAASDVRVSRSVGRFGWPESGGVGSVCRSSTLENPRKWRNTNIAQKSIKNGSRPALGLARLERVVGRSGVPSPSHHCTPSSSALLTMTHPRNPHANNRGMPNPAQIQRRERRERGGQGRERGWKPST